ncbi:hypothetical protein D3C86_1159740 [compost metagenome]
MIDALLVLGPAPANRQRQLVRQIVAEVSEDGEALGVDLAAGKGGQIGQADDRVEGAFRRGVHVEDARDALPALALEQDLEFLSELAVGIVAGDVKDRLRQTVEVDAVALGVAVAPSRHGLEGHGVVDVPFPGKGQAARADIAVVADARAGVVDAVGHRRLQAIAVTGVGLVLGDVARQAEEEVVGRGPFNTDATRRDVLIVVLSARGQVRAVTVAGIAGHRAADAQRVGQRGRTRGDQIDLVVAAVGALQRQFGVLAQALGDVLDRAADGVAAIEGALGPAQDLQPLDVEDVQHGALRTGHIDVVDVEADAWLEAPQRVLLTDPADKARQGGVGAARDLDRSVRGLLLQGGDVGGAGLLQTLRTDGGDSDRHVLQAFLAAARGDDDVVDAGGLLSVRRLLGEARRRAERSRDEDAGHQRQTQLSCRSHSRFLSRRGRLVAADLSWSDGDPRTAPLSTSFIPA